MSITIKPLSPELAEDYFDFFENRAFTDDSPYRCYCQRFQMTKDEFRAAYEGVPPHLMGQAARRTAQEQIDSGALQGYLAYDGDLCIGWCNANDRAHYPEDGINGSQYYAPAESREMAVVCFEIAPEYRGRGIATAFLQRVLEDAAAGGYKAVVSYPIEYAKRYEWDYTGPVRLYEKAGFVRTQSCEGYTVMRKELI